MKHKSRPGTGSSCVRQQTAQLTRVEARQAESKREDQSKNSTGKVRHGAPNNLAEKDSETLAEERGVIAGDGPQVCRWLIEGRCAELGPWKRTGC